MMSELAAGLLILSPLIASGAAAAIGVAWIRRPVRSPAFRAFFIGSVLAAAWLGVSALTRQAATRELAERWAAVGLAVAALLPPVLYRVATTFGAVGPPRRGWRRWGSWFVWLPALAVVALALGGRLVLSVEIRSWGFQPHYGELIWVFVGVFLALWVLSLVEIGRLARANELRSRQPHRWLSSAVIVAGGAVVELLPGLGSLSWPESWPGSWEGSWPVSSVPPFGFVPLLAFVALGARAFRPPGPEIPPETVQSIAAAQTDGLLVCDARGRIERVNDAFCSLAGRSRRRLLGRPVESLFRSSQEGGFPDGDWREGTVREQPATLCLREGDPVEVRVSVSPLRSGKGTVDGPLDGTVVLVKDLRERRRLQLRLEARFENLLESVPDPMAILDSEGVITRVNRRLESEFGYGRDELIGQPVEILIPEQRQGEHSLLHSEYLAAPTPRPMGAGPDLVGRRKDGSEFPVDVSLSPSSEGDGPGAITAIRDVSDRKRLEDELTRRTFHDSLTGLPNRALLMNRLRHALERVEPGVGPPFALLCIGLDRLEDITSSLGHQAGDELMVTCTERLQQFELAGDTIARLRDDAFVILQDRLGGVADATRLAERILEELALRIELAGQEVFVGASIGIALSTSGRRSAEELLRDAETAMHRARRRGPRSYEIFDPKMHREAAVRLELGMDLQRAVETDQLFLEYQPILSVSSGEIVGAEALLRWRHPKKGLIGPSDLIPLAEETGSIVAIGDWVLGAACRQSLRWQSAGPRPIFVAVNLSATQLRQREFPAAVRGVLRETGLDPAFLHLELTESLLVENSDLAVDALAALRATGAGLCVDDFGVGHSSLSYLQHLPIHTLKIDRSFVRPIGHEARSNSLMAAIIRIAHSLELKAIAEGVESEVQLDSLRSFACDQYQGYFYSPPLPEQDFTEMLVARTG